MEQIATVAPDVTPQFINSLTVFIGDKPVNVSKAARACNIAQPHLSRILSGQRTLTKPVAAYLAAALQLAPADIKRLIKARFNQKSIVIPQ